MRSATRIFARTGGPRRLAIGLAVACVALGIFGPGSASAMTSGGCWPACNPAPPAPTGLTITQTTLINPSGISVALQWTNNAYSNGGFTVQRAVGLNCFTNNSQCSWTTAANLGPHGVGLMSYTDTFSPLDAVCYRVLAWDLTHSFSSGTSNACVQPLAAPTNLTITSSSASTVTLQWQNPDPQNGSFTVEQGYPVQTTTCSGSICTTSTGMSWGTVATLGPAPAGAMSYTVPRGNFYPYRVRVWSGSRQTWAASNVVCDPRGCPID